MECFFKMVEPTESHKSFASLPYIKGVPEPLTRILKKHDVTVVKKHLPLYKNSSQLVNSDLQWNRRPMSCIKFPVQIVRGVILEKQAEPEHLRNIKTAAKLVLESPITPGPTTTSLILKTRQLLTKAPSEPEKH